MATEQELQRRRDEEQAARAEARRQAAIGAGHLEWLKLPERRDLARQMRLDQYFTGLPCEAGHVSPKLTRTGACIACKDGAQVEHPLAFGSGLRFGHGGRVTLLRGVNTQLAYATSAVIVCHDKEVAERVTAIKCCCTSALRRLNGASRSPNSSAGRALHS